MPTLYGMTLKQQMTVILWAKRFPLLIPTMLEDMQRMMDANTIDDRRLLLAQKYWRQAGGTEAYSEAEAAFLRPRRSFRMPAIDTRERLTT